MFTHPNARYPRSLGTSLALDDPGVRVEEVEEVPGHEDQGVRVQHVEVVAPAAVVPEGVAATGERIISGFF